MLGFGKLNVKHDFLFFCMCSVLLFYFFACCKKFYWNIDLQSCANFRHCSVLNSIRILSLKGLILLPCKITVNTFVSV